MTTPDDLSEPISNLMRSATPAPASPPTGPVIHITGNGNVISLGDLLLPTHPGAVVALNRSGQPRADGEQ